MAKKTKPNRGLFRGFFMPLALLASCQMAPENLLLNADEYDIAGVKVGMSEAEVIKILGKPDNIVTIFSGGDHVDFVYGELTVSMSARGANLDSPKLVSNIWSKNSSHCFNSVICPGDSLKAIMAQLGETKITEADNGKADKVFYLLPNLETCWLWVLTKDYEISSEITIACQP